MRKGILVVLVLAAWVVIRNQTYTQLFANKPSSVKQTAAIVAKTISNDLFQFTSVHLSAPVWNANKKIQLRKTCLLHDAIEKKSPNPEPLLLLNSL